MSSARFASITANLLARKGEARPWSQQDTVATPPLWRSEVRAATAMPPPPPPVKDRSCSVRMSAHDYERLGILAVKSGVTRQQLLKDALAEFLVSKAEDYGCACLGACDRGCADGVTRPAERGLSQAQRQNDQAAPPGL
jgi:predicted DNA-binding protein